MLMSMDSLTIRFECVKLCYRHDRTPADIIARSKELAKFIVGNDLPAVPVKPRAINRQAEQDISLFDRITAR